MKKIKLLTSLCSVCALGAVAASSTTKALESHVSATETGNFKVVCLNLPDKIYVGDTVTAKLYLVEENGSTMSNVTWTIISADECLNAPVGTASREITIKPTVDAVGKTNNIKLRATFNGRQVSDLDFDIDNIYLAQSRMTYNGVEYNLADNIDPNLFVTHRKSLHECRTQEIPLMDGSFIELGTVIGNNWNKLTSLTLGSCDPSVKTINEFFLADCDNLTSVDLSGLNNVTTITNYFLSNCDKIESVDLSPLTNVSSINHHFISNCPSLEYITVFDKSPTTMAINGYGFMENISKETIIECGADLYEYQHTFPWSEKSPQMKGEFGYSVAPLCWQSPFMAKNDDKILCNVTTTAKLQLLSNGKAMRPSPLDWRIEEGTSECLNATIEGNLTLSVTPTAEAAGKVNTLNIGVYSLGTDNKLASMSLTLNNVAYGNYMVYDGVQYELNPDINPNTFNTQQELNIIVSFNVDKCQDVWLADGGIKTIFNIRGGWNKLTALQLSKCNPIYTEIEDHFLEDCEKIKAVDLSGFRDIQRIGNNFLYGCESLNSEVKLPIALQSFGEKFMKNCKSFNYPMILPDSISVIPDQFMERCIAFNSRLVLPRFLITIGDEFLYDTDDFDQEFKLPTTLVSIGMRFLAWSEHFNQLLVIPSSVQKIGDSFMYSYKDFEVKNLRNFTNIPLELISRECHITGVVFDVIFAVAGIVTIVAGIIYTAQAITAANAVAAEAAHGAGAGALEEAGVMQQQVNVGQNVAQNAPVQNPVPNRANIFTYRVRRRMFLASPRWAGISPDFAVRAQGGNWMVNSYTFNKWQLSQFGNILTSPRFIPLP